MLHNATLYMFIGYLTCILAILLPYLLIRKKNADCPIDSFIICKVMKIETAQIQGLFEMTEGRNAT